MIQYVQNAGGKGQIDSGPSNNSIDQRKCQQEVKNNRRGMNILLYN